MRIIMALIGLLKAKWRYRKCGQRTEETLREWWRLKGLGIDLGDECDNAALELMRSRHDFRKRLDGIRNKTKGRK